MLRERCATALARGTGFSSRMESDRRGLGRQGGIPNIF